MKDFDICGMGELLIDFTTTGATPEGKPNYTGNPGGAPPNAVAAVAKLGGKAAFMSRVSTDSFGQFLKDTLQQLKIDTTGVVSDLKHNTTLAFVHNAPSGERSFSFYRTGCADAMYAPEDVNEQVLCRSKVFQLGSLMMSTPSGKAATMRALQLAKEHGVLISFDPNLRPNIWEDESQMIPCVKQVLPLADMVKISIEEARELTGHQLVQTTAKILMQDYPNIKLLLITLGEQGCYYCTQSFDGSVPAYQVSAVDTTGCGDAFTGGVIYVLNQQNTPLWELGQEQIQQAVRFGCAVGALVATQYGGILSMPTLQQVQTLLKEQQ